MPLAPTDAELAATATVSTDVDLDQGRKARRLPQCQRIQHPRQSIIAHTIQAMTDTTDKVPLFPRPLSLPLAIIPERVHGMAIVAVLNRVFAGALRDGELDYLQGRAVRTVSAICGSASALPCNKANWWPAGEAPGGPSITGTLHAFCCLPPGVRTVIPVFPAATAHGRRHGAGAGGQEFP